MWSDECIVEFQGLLSKQARSRSEANIDLPVFSCRRRAKRRSVDSSFNSHRGFSPLLECS